jgi:cobalt/nickel transport system permease protein
MLALHIPDGFFAPGFALGGWLLAAPALAWALRSWGQHDDERIPLAGLLAAFVFAAQTLQFPIPGGTTAHLTGAALTCLLLGPAAGLAVVACVTLLQALLFQVGGLLCLGWNLTNLGLLSGWGGWLLYRALMRVGLNWRPAVLISVWLATLLAGAATCLELAAAGTSPLAVSLLPMLLAQGLVGLGEAAVTLGTLGYLRQVRPQWAEALS